MPDGTLLSRVSWSRCESSSHVLTRHRSEMNEVDHLLSRIYVVFRPLGEVFHFSLIIVYLIFIDFGEVLTGWASMNIAVKELLQIEEALVRMKVHGRGLDDVVIC